MPIPGNSLANKVGMVYYQNDIYCIGSEYTPGLASPSTFNNYNGFTGSGPDPLSCVWKYSINNAVTSPVPLFSSDLVYSYNTPINDIKLIDGFIYLSRVNDSPCIASNDYSDPCLIGSQSIRKYDPATNTQFTGNVYTGFEEPQADYGKVIAFDILDSPVPSLIYVTRIGLFPWTYYFIRRSSLSLDYQSHQRVVFSGGYIPMPQQSHYSYTAANTTSDGTVFAAANSSYYDKLNNRYLFSARNTDPSYGGFVCLSTKILVVNLDDVSDHTTIDANSFDGSICAMGVRFRSLNTPVFGEDYVFVLDLQRGIVSALDLNDGYSMTYEWQLEDPIYTMGTDCRVQDFVIRYTGTKLICYYVTTSTTTAAPGGSLMLSLSATEFYDTKICATELKIDNTIGTIYSGYVNAPNGYPGTNVSLYLSEDDPESLYVCGRTIFKMCNLYNGN
jgi:hypothetical protein